MTCIEGCVLFRGGRWQSRDWAAVCIAAQEGCPSRDRGRRAWRQQGCQQGHGFGTVSTDLDPAIHSDHRIHMHLQPDEWVR